MSGMTILNMSITAVPLIAVIVLLRLFTVCKLPKKTFRVMWGIVLAQLLIPYNLFARFDISAHVTVRIEKLRELFVKAPETAVTISAAENYASIADTASILTEYNSTALNDIFGVVDRFVDRIDIMSTANADIVTAASGSAAAAEWQIPPLFLIWITGLLCFSVYFIVTHIKFRRIYEEALPIDSTFIRAWKVEYSDSLRRKVIIKQSDMITSPLTYGIVKPVILLPCNIDYSDETMLRYVLYHEYTHIRRFDTLSKLMLTTALCVHWFNPLVWVMYMLANRDIELSCDENVVKNITSGENVKADYAFTLIKLAEKKGELTLGVSFSRNIMKERITSIMKTKRSSLPRVIASVVLVSMVISMLASLQSFGSELKDTDKDRSYATELDENFVMQEQTDKLVLYSYGMNKFMIDPAVEIFKEMYPDVEVEIISLYTEKYEAVLLDELSDGKGPDLVLSYIGDMGSDIYKMMESEIFVDLNQFIGRDSDFNLDDYVAEVLDAGIYNGKRCIMPTEYSIPLMATTQEILDEEGINSDDISTFDTFLGIVEQYSEKYKDSSDKFAFSTSMHIKTSTNLRYFLTYSGIELIDYETGTVSADKAEFKNLMDLMKAVYIPETDSGDGNTGINYIIGKDLVNREVLFNNFYTMAGVLLFAEQEKILSANQTLLMFSYPNVNGGMTAEVQTVAAIPQASENQVNAYNFLKILLSEEIQGGYSDTGANLKYLRFGNPVLKSAVSMSINHGYRWRGTLDEESVNKYADMTTSVDSAMLDIPYALSDLVTEEMTPYFNGAKSFDDCYENLVSKLELYVSE